ncbi:MAG: TVP38/TMEM64 family protein [Candidatus Paceibacteria bacterium]
MSQTIWGPIIYIITYSIRPLTLLPGSAMTILAGVFFGLWGGIIYTIIGGNISSSIAYCVGRFFSSEKLKSTQTSYLGFIKKRPFESVLVARLSFVPYDLVNYGAGIIHLPFTPYIFATIIGTLLGTTTFVAIGAAISVEEFIENGVSTNVIDARFITLSVGILLLSIIIAGLIRSYKKTTTPTVSK